MTNPIDFYFDFSSPYGYLAAQRIEAVAEKYGRSVRWHPFLLGVALKISGGQPLVFRELLRDYSLLDFKRCARLYNIDYQLPSTFPVPTQAAARAYWWLHDIDEAAAIDLAKALYTAYFSQDHNIGDPEVVLDIAEQCGHDRQTLQAAIHDDAIKQRLKEVTNEAIEKGVCGSPYFFVDDEPFWGNDRLEHIDEWLRRGGW